MLSDGSTLYVPSVGQWSSAAGWAYALADASGTIVQTYTYAPFGELLAAQGTRPSALQYTGEQKDVDTGLVYLRARWYDSATGRFTTRDPFPGFAALPQTLHPYVYVNNNPVNLTDPSGEIAPIIIAIALGMLIGGGAGGIIFAITHPCTDLLRSSDFWQSILVGALSGGVAGFVGWLTPLLLPSAGGFWSAVGIGMYAGSAAGGAGQVTSNLLLGKPWHQDVLQTMLLGGLLGGIGGGVGWKIRQWAANRIGPIVPPSDRGGLRRAMGTPPTEMTNPQAHHDLPWNIRDWFAGVRRGLNVNDPNFGRWVEGTPPGQHQTWSRAFSEAWQAFKEANPNADRWEVLDFLKQLRSSGRYQ
jgi:RHS repeat-associated protein